jgi:hypothetical protein
LARATNDFENRCGQSRGGQGINGEIEPMNARAVFENVRRYRTIASLYRQTAAFRPLQRGSLLGQASEWEHRAVAELEAYFQLRDRWMVSAA